MDVVCCTLWNKKCILVSSFKMLIFGREEVYNVSYKYVFFFFVLYREME